MNPSKLTRLFALPLAGTLILLLIELLLRTPLAPSPWRRLAVGQQLMRKYAADPELGYKLSAPYQLNIAEQGLSLDFTHESSPRDVSLGHRSDGLGVKPPGGGELTALGDSTTYGWLVSDRDTWVSRLGVLTGLHATNLGVPGYGTSQTALLYRRHGRVSRNDLVLIQLCSNDILDNTIYRDWRKSQGAQGTDFRRYRNQQWLALSARSSKFVNFLINHSLLAHQILRIFLSERASRRTPTDSEAYARGMRITLKDVEELHQELSSEGTAFAVIIHETWRVFLPDKRAELRAFLIQKRIPFLDLGDLASIRYQQRRIRIWGDGHWNERGHALVAAETYRFLRREKLIARADARSTSGSPRAPAPQR